VLFWSENESCWCSRDKNGACVPCYITRRKSLFLLALPQWNHCWNWKSREGIETKQQSGDYISLWICASAWNLICWCEQLLPAHYFKINATWVRDSNRIGLLPLILIIRSKVEPQEQHAFSFQQLLEDISDRDQLPLSEPDSDIAIFGSLKKVDQRSRSPSVHSFRLFVCV